MSYKNYCLDDVVAVMSFDRLRYNVRFNMLEIAIVTLNGDLSKYVLLEKSRDHRVSSYPSDNDLLNSSTNKNRYSKTILNEFEEIYGKISECTISDIMFNLKLMLKHYAHIVDNPRVAIVNARRQDHYLKLYRIPFIDLNYYDYDSVKTNNNITWEISTFVNIFLQNFECRFHSPSADKNECVVVNVFMQAVWLSINAKSETTGTNWTAIIKSLANKISPNLNGTFCEINAGINLFTIDNNNVQ